MTDPFLYYVTLLTRVTLKYDEIPEDTRLILESTWSLLTTEDQEILTAFQRALDSDPFFKLFDGEL